jgi:hypothetical protein
LPPYLAWAKRDDTTDIAEQVFEDLRRAAGAISWPG